MLAETMEQVQTTDEEVIQSVERHLAAGLPQVRLSNMTAVDLQTLDSLLKRKPFGSGYSSEERYAHAMEALRAWVRQIEDQTETNRQGLAITPTYQRITAAIRLAHEQGRIVAITGGVGIGKSEAARAYALANPMTYQDKGVLRVEFAATDRTSASALSTIGDALGREGMGHPGYRIGGLMNQICRALRPGDALLLDEYNYLEGEAINLSRDLNQRAAVGVAMIGNPDFSKKVWGKSEEFAALANRALRFDFPSNTPDDVDAWINWKGYLGNSIREVAIKIATRPGKGGGLRSLATIIEHAEVFYGQGNVDAQVLLQSAQKLYRA